MKKVLYTLTILIFFQFSLIAYAWLVPGSIQKWINNDSIQCLTDTSSYVTSYNCVDAWSCNYWSSCSICWSYSTPIWCTWTGCTWTWCNLCNRSSWWTNFSWVSSVFNNYRNNSKTITYNAWSFRKISSDVQDCAMELTGVSSNSWLASTKTCSTSPCWTIWSWNVYYNAKDWYCKKAISHKTIINSYNQYWDRTYSYNDMEFVDTNYSLDTNLTATCEFEIRYAKVDDDWPIIESNWDNYIWDDDTWCNINRYHLDEYWNSWWTGWWGEPLANEGCESYKSKASHEDSSINNPDLLEGLWVSLEDSLSWLSNFQFSLWTCTSDVVYLPWAWDLSKILNWNPDGVNTLSIKSEYTQKITFKYDEESVLNIWWEDFVVKSLKDLFWKERLDECLVDWKNYLYVWGHDNAMTDSYTHANPSNTWYFNKDWIEGTINIDNAAAKFKVEWNTPYSIDGCVLWWKESDGHYKNINLTWNIQTKDEYLKVSEDECWFNTPWIIKKVCSWDKPLNSKWVSPIWVDPVSWEFSAYVDWIYSSFPQSWVSFPSTEFCDWRCSGNTIKRYISDIDSYICCNWSDTNEECLSWYFNWTDIPTDNCDTTWYIEHNYYCLDINWEIVDDENCTLEKPEPFVESCSTCNDWIQNWDETWIDCWWTCWICNQIITCSDYDDNQAACEDHLDVCRWAWFDPDAWNCLDKEDYSWELSSYTACSDTCYWTQTASYYCKNNSDWTIVDDSYCLTTKPSPLSRECFESEAWCEAYKLNATDTLKKVTYYNWDSVSETLSNRWVTGWETLIKQSFVLPTNISSYKITDTFMDDGWFIYYPISSSNWDYNSCNIDFSSCNVGSFTNLCWNQNNNNTNIPLSPRFVSNVLNFSGRDIWDSCNIPNFSVSKSMSKWAVLNIYSIHMDWHGSPDHSYTLLFKVN